MSGGGACRGVRVCVPTNPRGSARGHSTIESLDQDFREKVPARCSPGELRGPTPWGWGEGKAAAGGVVLLEAPSPGSSNRLPIPFRHCTF